MVPCCAWVTPSLRPCPSVSNESLIPSATEMGVIADEPASCRDLGESLEGMAERMDMQDMRLSRRGGHDPADLRRNLAVRFSTALAKVIPRALRLVSAGSRAITGRGEMVGHVPVDVPPACLVGINFWNPPTTTK